MTDRVQSMIRVDHAGETAAVAIYQAQQKVFGALRHKRAITKTLSEMEMSEHVHLNTFNDELRKRGARPTALIGLWQPLSFALGASTALMGEKCAHACTEAVEDVIEEHIRGRLRNWRPPVLSRNWSPFSNSFAKMSWAIGTRPLKRAHTRPRPILCSPV